MAGPLLTHKTLPAWLAATLLVLSVLLPLPFILDLQVNNQSEVYFSEETPIRQFEEDVRRQFPEDEVLITVFGGGALYEEAFLTPFSEVVKELEQHPMIERVVSVVSMDHITATDDGFSVEYLLKPGDVEHLSPQERQERVVEDHFAPRRVASADGSYLAMVVRPHAMADSREAVELEQVVRNTIEQNGLSNQLVAVAGEVAIDAALFDLMLKDNATFVPLTIVVGVVLLWWLFRRVVAVALAVFATVGVINAASVFVVLSGQPFSMPVSMITPLLTALTMAFFIHLFNALAHAAEHGFRGPECVRRAVGEVERPIRYTAVTTMFGLASLSLSPIPPLQTFGLASALGIGVLYVMTVWLVPPMLARWDRGSWTIRRNSGLAVIDKLIARVSRLGIQYAGVIVGATVLFIIFGSLQIFKVRAESDMLLYFAPDHAIVQSDSLIGQHIAGTIPLEVVFTADKRDSLKDPARLQAIKDFQQWLTSLPEVDHTLSMVDVIEEMHWAFHGKHDDYLTIPDNPRLISQYLFIYDGRELYELVNREFDRARLLVSLNVHGARQIRAAMDKIENYLATHDPGTDWQLTGEGLMLAELERSLIQGQLASGLGAFALIFMSLIVLWRSVSAALLCMLPNVAPLLFIFMIMGVLGMPLDIGTAIISSVAIGVAVDDTIHLYDGYLRRVRKGIDPLIALMRTYRTAGRAISATTLILCAQFFILATSDFIPTYQFGLMTGVGLLAAFLFDIFLLPALLSLAIRRKRLAAAPLWQER